MSDQEERLPRQGATATPDPSDPARRPVDSTTEPRPAEQTPPAGMPDFSAEGLGEEAKDPFAGDWENKKNEKQDGGGQMSNLILACAAVAVFEGTFVLIGLGLWLTNVELLVEVIRGFGVLGLLLGFGGMIPGWMALRQNKKTKTAMPGTMWANASVLAASALATLTLCVPIIATLRAIFTQTG